MTSFTEKYGPWAFIAGASMGIGAALSHEAAARGLNVLMLARGATTLEDAAAAVNDAHKVEVRTLAADLTDPDVIDKVSAAIADIDVGLFVYNAAVAPAAAFSTLHSLLNWRVSRPTVQPRWRSVTCSPGRWLLADAVA